MRAPPPSAATRQTPSAGRCPWANHNENAEPRLRWTVADTYPVPGVGSVFQRSGARPRPDGSAPGPGPLRAARHRRHRWRYGGGPARGRRLLRRLPPGAPGPATSTVGSAERLARAPDGPEHWSVPDSLE